MALPCPCFRGLFGAPSQRPGGGGGAEEKALAEESFREEVRGQLEAVCRSFVQELRAVEVQLSQSGEAAAGLRDKNGGLRRYLQDVELLNRQILQLEQNKRRRSKELTALRRSLTEHRRSSVNASDPEEAAQKLEEAQLLEEMRSEREAWRGERRELEQEISGLEEELRLRQTEADPEKERLRRSVKQLQMSIDSRDRYACWVCNQRASSASYASYCCEAESEGERPVGAVRSDASASSVGNEDEVAGMRQEIARMRKELRGLRGDAGPTPPSSAGASPAVARQPSVPEEAAGQEEVFRDCRDRISTPFVFPNDLLGTEGSVRFAETASEAPAPAVPAQANMGRRSSRDRVATPYVPDGEDSGSRGRTAERISFAARDETFETGVPAASLKSVRGRQSTGYVPIELPSPGPTAEDKCVRFGKSFSDGASSVRSPSDGGSLRLPQVVSREEEFSDVETTSSCSSRNQRSRLSTPHVSPSLLTAGGNSSRRPRSRSTSTTSEAQRCSLKQVSVESSVEREISERVRRHSEARQQSGGCSDERLLRGKMNALGPAMRGCLTPVGAMPAGFGFGLEDAELAGQKVEGAVKDSDLLRRTLRRLAFFEDFDERGLDSLVEAMEVYEYADGEEVVRQGDNDGSHFYVVAAGEFVELRDGQPYCVIGPGCCFGESVLVLFGERSASVRSKGRSRAYAMEGLAVREMLRDQFEQRRSSVIDAVDEMLCAESCSAFSQLNAYQLQTLYEEVSTRNYSKGEIILAEGPATSAGEILVLASGSVASSLHGKQLGFLGRWSLMGDRALLYQEQPTTLTAAGAVEALVLPLPLLKDVFGDELTKLLLRARILAVLAQHKVFGRLHEEQRAAVLAKAEVVVLKPGETLRDDDLRFVACLHGEVETTLLPAVAGAERRKLQLLRCSTGQWSTFGDENLLSRERPHYIQVRATGGTPSVTLATWHGRDLDGVLEFGNFESALAAEDRLRVLRTLFLFQTLSRQQLARLANALQVHMANCGETVFRQGEVGTHLYILRRGQVLIEIGGNKVRTLGAGDYFGERALLSSEPRTASVTTIEDCELWMMDKPTFAEVMQGPCLEYLTTRIALQDTRLSMADLVFLRVIGRGGFGVVKLVKCSRTGMRYALKCVRKRNVIEKSLQDSLVSERSILAEVDHPFIVKFVRSFKNARWLYFLMEVVTGGELLDALEALGLLGRDQAAFYAGTLVLALEFLHARRIAYLDLKSENCLVDQQGYLKIIDFGIAQRIVGSRCHAVMGTPIFMAPEIVLGKGYTTVADLWSLGVCLYEFLIGDFPIGNTSMNHGQIFNEILRAQVCFPAWFEKRPDSPDAISLIRGLLTREPAQRLGAAFDGYETLKAHPFFAELDWDKLLGREVKPPFVPQTETYAEDKEAGEGEVEGARGRTMEEVEAEVDTDEGWEDPEPGWDEDF